MFEAKTNGAKWRELSAATVDAAAPQAMPTQPRAGQRPIAELVIEDIRARAELGVRKYGAPLHAHNGRSALMDLYQELLDGAHYVRQEIEERAIATSSNAGVVGTVLLPLLDALGWDESKGEPVEWARAVVFARNEAQALIALRVGEVGELRAEIESLKAGLRALANVRDEGAAETARWRDRALCAEAKAVALKEEHAAVESWGNEGAREMKAEIDRLRALLSKVESDRAESDELFARIVVLVDRVSALRTAVRAARVRAQQAERNAEGYHNDADVLSVDLDEAHAKLDEVAARRGERDDLLVQLAAKTRETEEAQRARDAAIAAGLGIEAERAALAAEARARAEHEAAVRSNGDALAADRETMYLRNIGELQAEIEAAWAHTGRTPQERMRKRNGRLIALGDVISDLQCMLTEARKSIITALKERDNLAAEVEALKVGRAPRAPALASEIRPAGEGYPTSGAPNPAQATETQEGWRPLGPDEVIEDGDMWWTGSIWCLASTTFGKTPEGLFAEMKQRGDSEVERVVFCRRITKPSPAQATVGVGSAEVAPAAPVETPQATETQPDPGEGWRLLGPEEVIETGDQWWGGAMVGPVWLAASATIGETPAAINAHPRATERRVFRRLIAAPIAPAPAVEPVTEVAIEARGSKFVIVRRAVAP